MEEFFGEQIEVEKEETSPRPWRFTWRGEVHDVAEVLNERVVRAALWQQVGADNVIGRKNERDNNRRRRREWSSCASLSILVTRILPVARR